MKYKLSSDGNARSQDYMGTITTLHDSDLERIKKNTKIHNAQVRADSRRYGRPVGQLRRVRIMGRGPRTEASMAMYGRPRTLDSYLPLGLSEYFDVYMGEDGTAQHELKRELETGMTPGELKKVDKLKDQIWRIELDVRMRKRNKQ